MRKRRRVRKWAKWACTLAAAATAGLAVFSIFFQCFWVRGPKAESLTQVWFGAGLLGAVHLDQRGDFWDPDPGWQLEKASRWSWTFSDDSMPWRAGVSHSRAQGFWSIGVSLGYPVLLTTIPAALLWYADRRRFGPGFCAQCGYDRRGLAAGIKCPECGAPAAPAPK